MPYYLRHLAPLALGLAVSSAALAADRNAAVTGVVRDAQGVPQMGVLVELLGPGTTISAFTDLQGRYTLRSLTPGLYQMRASATLFVPILRSHLQVRAGQASVLNLTLTGLFDDAAWFPARPRHLGESPDDWKWTLRSQADRPMLRVLEDGSRARRNESEAPSSNWHGAASAFANSGLLGSSPTVLSVTLAERRVGHADQLVSATVGSSRDATVPSFRSSVLLSSSEGHATQRLTAIRVQSLPQVTLSAGSHAAPGLPAAGLLAVEISSAQRMELGDWGGLEVGGRTQLVHLGQTTVVTRPFLRLASHPIGGWNVRYAMAASPWVQSYRDLRTSEDSVLPTVISTGRGLSTDSGLHQELRARRSLGHSRIQVVYFHDRQHRTPLTGRLLSSVNSGHPISGLQGVMLDTGSGIFGVLGPAFVSEGYGAALDQPVTSVLTLSAAYSSAAGLSLAGRSLGPASLVSHRGSVVLLAAHASMPRIGTRLGATYRQQPTAFVSVLAPFDAPDTGSYLGVHIRQALPQRRIFSERGELTLDCTNVLAQGYHSIPGGASNAVLASALREIRAGLIFSF